SMDELIADFDAVRDGRTPSVRADVPPPALPGPSSPGPEDPKEDVPLPVKPPKRPPVSRPVAVVIGAVLALSVVALVADGRRTWTGDPSVRGEDAPGLRLTVRQGGRVVVPPTNRRLLELPPGDYEVVLDPATGGLRVVPGRVRVERARRSAVRVERVP